MLLLATKTPSEFTDLVNNYDLFHEYWNDHPEKFEELPEWEDDRDYRNLETLDELMSRLSLDTLNTNQVYDVSIMTSQFYSSPDSVEEKGFDRTHSCFTPAGMKICIDNLNKEVNGQILGYRASSATSISIWMRFDKKTQSWVPVKDKGNHRTNMSLLCSRGEDVPMKAEVRFHNPNATLAEMMQREAQEHFIDAQQQKNQNEGDKFISGVKANDPNQMFCFNYLKKHQINYKSSMQSMGVEGCEDWLEITNLTQLTSGKGNGIFKYFGEECVDLAFDTIKDICKITGERSFSSTPLHCFASMYFCLTNYGKSEGDSLPLFTKEQLKQFFIAWYTEKNKISPWNQTETKPIYGLKRLRQSGHTKNYAFLYVKTFWPDIVQYFKFIRESKYGFRSDSVAGRQIILRVDDTLKGEARVLMDAA